MRIKKEKLKITIILISLSIIISCGTINEMLGSVKTVLNNNNENIENNSVNSLTDRMINDGWDIEELDTARNIDYLTKNEKDVILATNAVRTNPKKFADLYVKELQNKYNGEFLEYPGEIRIKTSEGTTPVNELYKQLQIQKTNPIIVPSKGMSLAAKDHSNDQSKTGKTGHTGSDNSDPFIRLNRYGKWNITAGENISYGSNKGLRIILELLVDDGVPSRGHRKNILNNNFEVTGVSINTHKVYRNMCVITYAGQYIE